MVIFSSRQHRCQQHRYHLYISRPPTSQDFPRATINTQILNVREAPDPGSRVLTQVRQGETYTVHRGANNGWLQLIVNGQLGWVSGNLVTLDTRQNLVNLVANATATVRAARLNVRNSPNLMSGVVGKVNRLENHAIVGTDATQQWILLDVNGTFGWVNRDFVELNTPSALPVVGDVPPVIPPAREYIVATATPYNVNIRQAPGTNFADIGNFERGTDARVIGRTADNNWWQIEVNGVRGWVAASFALIQQNADINAIPVTGVTGQV
jgi:N-acetylmuramoyl-L-alanine amidase